MPADGGSLILTIEQAEEFRIIYPNLNILVKRFIGAEEFINGFERSCFWITDENYHLCNENPFIQSRLVMCKDMRLKSKKKPTQQLGLTPWRFGEIRYKPTDAIIVPAVSSERREYIPMGYVDKDTVISNSAFAVYDAELWLFGILTSKMHNIWVRAVGGSLETRIRYSATLCYNTFPFPKINAMQKAELEALAQEVLDIRDRHFDMTLGEMYNPETMPDDLREAHHRLDLAIERCYRPEPFTSDEERLEYLFKLYVKMTKKN